MTKNFGTNSVRTTDNRADKLHWLRFVGENATEAFPKHAAPFKVLQNTIGHNSVSATYRATGVNQ